VVCAARDVGVEQDLVARPHVEAHRDHGHLLELERLERIRAEERGLAPGRQRGRPTTGRGLLLHEALLAAPQIREPCLGARERQLVGRAPLAHELAGGPPRERDGVQSVERGLGVEDLLVHRLAAVAEHADLGEHDGQRGVGLDADALLQLHLAHDRVARALGDPRRAHLARQAQRARVGGEHSVVAR
jgi:hypothetical protein